MPAPWQISLIQVVLVDDHDRHVPVARVRYGQPPATGEVHHGEAVEGVTVEPDDRLLLDLCRLAVVTEGVAPTGGGLDIGERQGKVRPVMPMWGSQ